MASHEADKYGRLLRVPNYAWQYATKVGARRGHSASATLQRFIREAIEADAPARAKRARKA